MNFNLFLISPEIILAAGGIVTLFVGLFTCKGARITGIRIFSPEIFSLLVLSAAFMASIRLVYSSNGVSQFGWMIAVDGFAIYIKIIASLSAIIVVLLSMDYFRSIGIHKGEYYALLIFAVLAINMLSASTDMIMIYLSMEFLSIVSYVLSGIDKKNPRSNEAAIKYFLYGSVAAAVMLYGMSMLYGLTGTTDILAMANTGLDASSGHYAALILSTIMVLVGFGFKTAMVPFHQWAPDVYEGAPTPISAFLSVASKAAGLAILTRLLATGLQQSFIDWMPIILVLSAVTMTVGNIVAISQTNIKRMLAYSSIAQAGYILMAVAAIPYTDTAVPAVLIYLFVYLFMNLGAFAVVAHISPKINSEEIEEYAGLAKRSPVIALAMFFFMLSLAGIPPTAGFLGKFYLFSAAINANNVFIFALAVLAIINTVISVYYYFNVVREMYFVKAEDDSPIESSGLIKTVIAITLGMTIIVFLFPRIFIDLAASCSMLFSNR